MWKSHRQNKVNHITFRLKLAQLQEKCEKKTGKYVISRPNFWHTHLGAASWLAHVAQNFRATSKFEFEAKFSLTNDRIFFKSNLIFNWFNFSISKYFQLDPLLCLRDASAFNRFRSFVYVTLQCSTSSALLFTWCFNVQLVSLFCLRGASAPNRFLSFVYV